LDLLFTKEIAESGEVVVKQGLAARENYLANTQIRE
jgi:hypothetical protein